MATVTKKAKAPVISNHQEFTQEEWKQYIKNLKNDLFDRNEICLYYAAEPTIKIRDFDIWNCDFTDLQANDVDEYEWYDISDDARQFLQNEFSSNDEVMFVGLHNLEVNMYGGIELADLDAALLQDEHHLLVIHNVPLRRGFE